MKLIKYKKGQSLFELMIAVAVVALTLVAIISLVGSTVSNTAFSRDRTQATRFTNEAIEWIRNRRDLSWSTFISGGSLSGTTYCLNELTDTSLNISGPCSGLTITDTKFVREAVIIYDDTDPNRVEVRVITTWSDSGGDHESRVSTVFTNWRTE